MNDATDPPPQRPATRISPSSTPGIDGLVTLAVGVTVVAGLYFGRAVLIPITLAILLSFLVAPLADFMRRFRIGHVASVFVAVGLSVSVIVLFGTVIATQLTDLAAGIPRYQATIERKLDAAHNVTVGRLDHFASVAGQALQRVTAEPPAAPADRAPHALTPTPSRSSRSSQTSPPSSQSSASSQPDAAMPVEVREPVPTPFELARRVVSPVISPLETTFIVFVVMVVILLQRDDLRDRAIRLFGSRDLHRTTTVMDEAARRLSRYFVSQLGVNAGVGVLVGVGLQIIGVPSPVLWGIMAALLRLVPYVGIWISAALATALAAAVGPGWSMALWSIALFVTVEVVVGQVVEPLLYGHSTGLSPFSVVVAAIFWSSIWGPIGLILSTPLTLCLLVLGRHVRRLEFLDVLLGDQPALTPVENFYQRALAGDPDEAIGQAEIMLRDRSLATYYDEVAIKGLRLAANDVVRGRVTAAQLARIETTTNDLMEGLESYDDIEPGSSMPASVASTSESIQEEPPLAPVSLSSGTEEEHTSASGSFDPRASSETVASGDTMTGARHRVICISGRGPLDALASSIVVQLLGKHEFECRIVPNEAASRTTIATLDIADVDLVCIFYLQIEGIPSHLRYLVKRVRERLPDASIVVGLWPSGLTDRWSEDLQSALGADHYATSMKDMIHACMKFSTQPPAATYANGVRESAHPVDGVAA